MSFRKNKFPMRRPTLPDWLPLGGKFIYLILFTNLTLAVANVGNVQKNILRFGYGVNFKFNGQLHHGLDRVWVVHRISLPQVSDVESLPKFPNILQCNLQHTFKNLTDSHERWRAVFIDGLCEATVPYLKMIYSQSEKYKREISRMISQDLHLALYGLNPVGKNRPKRALTLPTLPPLQDNETRHPNFLRPIFRNIQRVIRLAHNRAIQRMNRKSSKAQSHSRRSQANPPEKTSNRSKRAIPGLVPLVGGLVTQGVGALITLARESISAHISKKRSKAIAKAMVALEDNAIRTKNKLQLLEKDFLMYGDFDINSTMSIIEMFQYLGNRTLSLEQWIRGHDPYWSNHYIKQTMGQTMYVHQLHLYINSVKEKYIRLYQRLENELKLIIRSIGILSTGHLPPHLFPPSLLAKISKDAIQMVKPQHPDYVLAFNQVLDYYDMPLVTFGRDRHGRLIICFPIFIKEYHRKPYNLYQVETVKVPIADENSKADSYTEIRINKPYLAANSEYFIELVQPELRMCKAIRNTYFCEELFLTKHNTRESCVGALFYNNTSSDVGTVCDFDYYYNISTTPSVLDGGSEIVLANFKDRKVLTCPHRPTHSQPMPIAPFTKISRDVLCFCDLQAGLTSLHKSISYCNTTKFPQLEYSLNLGFYDTFRMLHEAQLANLSAQPTLKPQHFPIALEDFSKDKYFAYYCPDANPIPSKLKQLAYYSYQKKLFLENRDKFSLITKGKDRRIDLPNENSFLFSAIFHMYVAIGSTLAILQVLPCIIMACKQKKLGTAISAFSVLPPKAVEALETVHDLTMQAVHESAVAEQKLGMTVQGPQRDIYAYQPVRLHGYEALKAGENLVPAEAPEKTICHNQWVTMTVTGITLLGVVIYVIKEYKPWQLIKGFRNPLLCEVFLCIKSETNFVPIKIGEFEGSPTGLRVVNPLMSFQIKLIKGNLFSWDHLRISYAYTQIWFDDKQLELKTMIAIPMTDKYRFRKIYDQHFTCAFMAQQNGIRYIIGGDCGNDCKYCLNDVSSDEEENIHSCHEVQQ